MKPLKIGSHVGMSGKEMLLGSVKEAVSYGANTFMFYTGAPQNTRRKELSELNIEPAWEYMKEPHVDPPSGRTCGSRSRSRHKADHQRIERSADCRHRLLYRAGNHGRKGF